MLSEKSSFVLAFVSSIKVVDDKFVSFESFITSYNVAGKLKELHIKTINARYERILGSNLFA